MRTLPQELKAEDSSSSPDSSSMRKGGGVAYRTGLLNRSLERDRRFESCPFLQFKEGTTEWSVTCLENKGGVKS